MPAKLAPMLAEIGDAAFTKPDWTWELKLDGYRVLAFIDGTNGRRLRRGLDLTPAFPRLAAEPAASRLRHGARWRDRGIFDTNGKPSFNALQNRVRFKSAREIAGADQIDTHGLFPVSTCCISPASTCATRRIAIVGATCRSACFLRRSFSLHATEDADCVAEQVPRAGSEGVRG